MIFGRHTYDVSIMFMQKGQRPCIRTLALVTEYDCTGKMITWVKIHNLRKAVIRPVA